jgi:glycosyltransferase involved in cell wall biosynthesis
MISVIVPLYFSRLELYPIITTCIDSFHEFKTPNMEMVLVDDCSPHDISDWKADKLIRKSENTGYTNTVNTGLKAAQGDILVVVNDDVTFNPQVMEKLWEIADGAIYLPTWAGEMKSNDDKFGFFWGLTRNTLNQLGYLDESMKHYFSDLDLWKRAKQGRVQIVKWWDTPVLHYSGATYQGDSALFEHDKEAYRQKWGHVD